MWFSELKYEINIGPALLQLIYLKVGLIVQLFAFLHFLMIQVISSILNHTYFFSMANWYVRFSTQLILRGLFSIKRFSSTAFLQGNRVYRRRFLNTRTKHCNVDILKKAKVKNGTLHYFGEIQPNRYSTELHFADDSIKASKNQVSQARATIN